MRKANEKIALLRQYLEQPTANKERRSLDDPYFYGMDGSSWRSEQDQLHRDIKASNNRQLNGIRDELVQDWGISPEEANLMIRHSRNPRNRHARHIEMGVAPATVSEEIARLALDASGTSSQLANRGNPFATDLTSMIDNLNAYIDVQNRYVIPGMKEIDTIPVLTNVRPGVPQQVFGQAQKNDTLRTIVQEVMNRSPDLTIDKLMHTRANANAGLITQDQVKDYLIGGVIDPRTVNVHALRQSQGSYDPQAPRNMEVTDLAKLRDSIQGMTKGDLLDSKGNILQGEDRKLKLRIPHEVVREMSRPSNQLLDDEVKSVLNYYA